MVTTTDCGGMPKRSIRARAKSRAGSPGPWEADSVSDRERAETYGKRPEDFLLLTRRKRHVSTYARALQARGIAVDVSGSEGFSISEGLRALRPLLSAALDPGDEVSAVAFLTGPPLRHRRFRALRLPQGGGRFSANASPPAGSDPRLSAASGFSARPRKTRAGCHRALRSRASCGASESFPRWPARTPEIVPPATSSRSSRSPGVCPRSAFRSGP